MALDEKKAKQMLKELQALQATAKGIKSKDVKKHTAVTQKLGDKLSKENTDMPDE